MLARTCSHSLAGSGRVSEFDHVGLEVARALIAAHSFCATTREEIALAHHLDDAGDVLDRALVDAFELGAHRGRADTRPCSMPGTRKSCM